MLVAVVERGAGFFDDAASQVMATDGSPSETMYGLIAGHVGVLLDHRPEARTYLTEVDFLDSDEQQRVNDIRDRYEEAFSTTVSAGVEDGVFRSDCDPKLAAIYILSVLNAMDRWYNEDGRLGKFDIVDDIYRFVSAALA